MMRLAFALFVALFGSLAAALCEADTFAPVYPFVLGGDAATDFLNETGGARFALAEERNEDRERIVLFYADSKLQTGSDIPLEIFSPLVPLQCANVEGPSCCADGARWLQYQGRWLNTGLDCPENVDARKLLAPLPLDPVVSHQLRELANLEETLLAVPGGSTRFFTMTAALSDSCVYSVSTCSSPQNEAGVYACKGSPGRSGTLYAKRDCMGTTSTKEWYKWSSCRCNP